MTVHRSVVPLLNKRYQYPCVCTLVIITCDSDRNQPINQLLSLCISFICNMFLVNLRTHQYRFFLLVNCAGERQSVGHSDHAVTTAHVFFLLKRPFIQCYSRFIGCNVCLAMSCATLTLFN